MAPKPGTILGHYEILSLCGAGGMGEVYRARDLTLGREVAIKLLPDRFASERDRLARFEREARLLGSLNHPNIATLHGLEEAEGRRFLVMELVLGETLAERLQRGKLRWKECLPIFLSIAEGLECAHEAGVVHRDLKPSNLKIAPSGVAKILDFGLAKALADNVAGADGSESATRDLADTQSGIVLGTTPYLSPEQARGVPVDRRADIWAFGCVLYEALAGQRAFSGDSHSETIAAILEREPDWNRLPKEAPPRLRALLERCLRKDPRARLRDIGDARLELEACRSEVPVPEAATTRGGKRWLAVVPWALATFGMAAAVAALWIGSLRPTTEPAGPTRFEVAIPAGEVFGLNFYPSANVALSPDGRRLAYVAMKDGLARLHLRSLGELEPRAVPGTEGAHDPFFSPDGEWLGFFARGAMSKISVRGGPPVLIGPVPPVSRGAAWLEDGTIVFAPTFSGGLSRISSNGGEPGDLTKPDASRGEVAYLWPHALPGGRGVLFTIWTGGSFETAKIAALSLTNGSAARLVVDRGSHPQYSGSGHLLYLRSGVLLAQPFDVSSLEVRGEPVAIVERVMASALTGAGEYAVSRSGTLAYVAADPSPGRLLLWVDREGRAEPVVPDVRRDVIEVRLAPDGKRIALGILNDIWIYDPDRGSFQRLTFTGINQCPVWSPDGSEIVFSHAGPEEPRLFRVAADGTGLREVFPDSLRVQLPFSWSPDGTVLAYAETPSAGLTKGPDDWDIIMLPWGKEPFPFVRQEFDQGQPMFSPDGKWVAYVSTESNMPQVFVRSYPEGSPKWLVSPERGDAPMWSYDGKEIFYRDGARLLAVSVQAGPRFEPSRPRVLFEDRYLAYSGVDGCSLYDVSRDGRFLMIEKDPPEAAPRALQVVLNWAAEIEKGAR